MGVQVPPLGPCPFRRPAPTASPLKPDQQALSRLRPAVFQARVGRRLHAPWLKIGRTGISCPWVRQPLRTAKTQAGMRKVPAPSSDHPSIHPTYSYATAQRYAVDPAPAPPCKATAQMLLPCRQRIRCGRFLSPPSRPSFDPGNDCLRYHPLGALRTAGRHNVCSKPRDEQEGGDFAPYARCGGYSSGEMARMCAWDRFPLARGRCRGFARRRYGGMDRESTPPL